MMLLLALLLAILMLAARYPAFIERYYSDGLYPVICSILHPIFNLSPFSIGDVLYITAVIYLVYAAVRLVWLAVKRKWLQTGKLLSGLVIGIEGAVLIFYLFWGMNYFRPPAAKRLNLTDTGYTAGELRAAAMLMIDSANACRASLTSAIMQTGNQEIFNSAINAVGQLSVQSAHFKTCHPKLKASFLTFLLNYMGTSGYYNPFTTESQMNCEMPVYLRPFVACHELSHQLGYGPEDEANFIGFFAAFRSKDKLMRYSAYYIGAEEFLYALRQQDSAAQKEIKKRLSPAVRQDMKNERKYWLSFESKAGILSSIFYDDFLKANNQPQGLRTYNRMVLLIMAYYKKYGYRDNGPVP